MRTTMETLSIIGACPLRSGQSRRKTNRWLVARTVRSRFEDICFEDFVDLRVFVASPTFTGLTVRGVTIPVSKWMAVKDWVVSGGGLVEFPQFTLELNIDSTTDLVCGFYDDNKYGKYVDLRYYVRKDSYVGWDKRGVRVVSRAWPQVKRLLASISTDLKDWRLPEFAGEEIRTLLSKYLTTGDSKPGALPFDEDDVDEESGVHSPVSESKDASQDSDPATAAGWGIAEVLNWMDPAGKDEPAETKAESSPEAKRGEAFFEKLDGFDIREWDAQRHLLWVGDLCQLQGPVENETVDRLGVFRVTLDSGRTQTVLVALRHDDNNEGFFWVFSICGQLKDGPSPSHLLKLNTRAQPGAHGVVLVEGEEHVVYFNSVRAVDNWQSALARTIWDVARRGDSLEQDGWGTDQY